jgi:lipoprotein signal peptidase
MGRSALALAAVAVFVAGADLVHKTVSTADGRAVPLHERSAGYALVLAAALAWAAALLAARSPLLAAAGGVVAGGALGNVLSLALWAGVPDPLVADGLGVAFNLADVAALAGGAVLVPLAVLALAVRRRADLRRPVTVR